MKILNKEQIQKTDTHTIENEPIKSVDLMERASRAFTHQFGEYFAPDTPVKVFAGKGNNGGDGLAIARLLLDRGYPVTVYLVQYTNKASEDFQVNAERLEQYEQVEIHDLYENTPLPELTAADVVIDAMWGSGLDRPIEGFARQVIEGINASPCSVVAVDIPSGVYCDAINEDPAKVHADYTFTFQLPKRTFFFPENQDTVGEFKILDIGLDQHFIEKQPTAYYWTNPETLQPWLKPRKQFQHKGHFGHTLIIAGSYGKIGASIISGRSCLKAGTGLLTIFTAGCGYQPVQTALPEAMVKTSISHDLISSLPDPLSDYDAIGIGPGIGQDPQTIETVSDLLKSGSENLVLDADALNILAQKPELFEYLSGKAILTPHPGEFARLKGRSANSEEQLEKLKALATETGSPVVLKGRHTAIALPDGNVWFNMTGNPGMATAGSGDVLTGILASLLGQGYSAEKAAILGVYLHGLAGDIANLEEGDEGLIASNLINQIPVAFQQLHKRPKGSAYEIY